jgi:hypothetical protein
VPDSISALEAQRTRLLQEFLGLGDLRPGSITGSRRLCGKPSCHCARPHDPGHDPQFRLTRKAKGKTVNESFPSPAALRKAGSRRVPSPAKAHRRAGRPQPEDL